MTFKRANERFDLKDIGAQVIDQISSDIYSGPGSIIREIVKNAYDAYIAVDPADLEADGVKREILISRRRENGTGILTIADSGIGQSLKKLRENVQISISHKQDELDDAMGFRGLGSWAVLGAGSTITITSKMKGDKQRARLRFDVRRIYETITPHNTLADVLNDPKCIEFSTEELTTGFDEHGTTVEIECDGNVEKVNNLELNRLFPYTDETDPELRRILSSYCPVPYSAAYSRVHEVYARARYIPTAIVLDGESLERSLPSELSTVSTHDIVIGDTVAAVAWYAEDPQTTGAVSVPQKHFVGGAGMQLVKLNVPIGLKNVFVDDESRDQNLKWYIGEVHIVLTDVLPNASGDDLRAGSSRDLFIAELNKFYRMLDKRARQKSQRVSYTRHLKRAKDAVESLKGKVAADEKVKLQGLIVKGLQTIEEIQKKARGTGEEAQSTRDVIADASLRTLLDSTKRLLKKEGYVAEFGKQPTKKTSKKSASAPVTQPAASTAPNRTDGAAERFSTAVAEFIPQLEALGLDQKQLKGVLDIVARIFSVYEGA